MTRLAERVRAFRTTIFTEITGLATAAGAINLGQGDPDIPTPPDLLAEGHRQLDLVGCRYPRTYGHPELNKAIAEHQQRFYGLTYDPETEVTVTTGSSEAIGSAAMAVVEPGSEVILLEPYYETYRAAVHFAGGVAVPVPTLPPDFALDLDRIAAAITPRTRAIFLNSPQNPSGKVLTEAELAGLAKLCRDHDLIAVTDEVYEHLAFSRPHKPLASFEGMRERTILISSASKTFSVTGWRIGWACCPPALTTAIRIAKATMSFATPSAFQPAVAYALRYPAEFFASRNTLYRERRDLMVSGLRAVGIPVLEPDGGIFAVADFAPLGVQDGEELCRRLPAASGVAAIPMSAFSVHKEHYASLVRITFCKPVDVLEEAIAKLGAFVKTM